MDERKQKNEMKKKKAPKSEKEKGNRKRGRTATGFCGFSPKDNSTIIVWRLRY